MNSLKQLAMLVTVFATLFFVTSRFASAAEGESASAKLDEPKLQIVPGVNIGENPVNDVDAVIHQTVQLQVGYPSAPPFPVKATVKVSSRGLSAIAVHPTGQEVFAPKGGEKVEGKIGVNWVSAFVKVNNNGKGTATVTFSYPDGSEKHTKFSFDIK